MGKIKTIQIIIEELNEKGYNTTLEEIIEIATTQAIPIEKTEEYIIQNRKNNITV